MDEIVKIADGLVRHSQTQYKAHGPKYTHTRWKYCVALVKEGWRAYECVNIENTDEVLIKWRKEGKKDIGIRLSFMEQCLWIKYLEKNNEC